jgi:hypothetical protein
MPKASTPPVLEDTRWAKQEAFNITQQAINKEILDALKALKK